MYLMRNINRVNLSAAILSLLVLSMLPAVGLAAPGGARPSEPTPPTTQAPAPGAKPDPGATVNDPRGDPELSRACLDLAVEKLRAEYAASVRDPRASLREKSSYFIGRPARLHEYRALRPCLSTLGSAGPSTNEIPFR